MLGSQVVEVAIGLPLVFFVLALASSAVTEIVSQAMSKRSRDLKKAIGRIVAGQSDELTKTDTRVLEFVGKLYDTSPISSLVAASKGNPSYIARPALSPKVSLSCSEIPTTSMNR